MPKGVRLIDRYSPMADLGARHPGWDVQLVSDLPSDLGEIFLPKRRTILIARALYEEDPDLAVAHACAHLDLHRITGAFSRAQEVEADTLADIRLDREGSR